MLDPIFLFIRNASLLFCAYKLHLPRWDSCRTSRTINPRVCSKNNRGPWLARQKGSKIGESLKISKFPCMEIKVCCCLERGIDRITFLFPPLSLPLSFFLLLLYLSSFSLFNENQRGYSQLAGSFLCACCVRARRHTQHPCQQQRRKHLLLRPQHLQASFLPLRIPIASRWIVAKGRASGKPWRQSIACISMGGI